MFHRLHNVLFLPGLNSGSKFKPFGCFRQKSLMGLRDIGETLPPGFKFCPSDEELICHYLYKKVTNEEVLKGTLVDIDLHVCEPWQLPEVAKLNANEWYFFSFRDRKYATGYRTNRATTNGYWKATGKDRIVQDPMTHGIVGMRKTLVFYRNRAPNGIKTGWIMHEFRLETPHMPPKEDWVLCRVFLKSKAENSTRLSPEYVMNNADFVPYLHPSSPSNQEKAFCSTTPHLQTLNHCPSLLNLIPFDPRNHKNSKATDETSSQTDSEFGFLWDMSLDEHGFEKWDGFHKEEMKFGK